MGGQRSPTALQEVRSGGNGAPGGIRTHDPEIRNLVLYPAELRARVGCYIARLTAVNWETAVA